MKDERPDDRPGPLSIRRRRGQEAFETGPKPRGGLRHGLWFGTAPAHPLTMAGREASGEPAAFAREASRLTGAIVRSHGGTVSGEALVPPGSVDFSNVVRSLEEAGPLVVFSTIIRNSNVAFYRQLAAPGLAPSQYRRPRPRRAARGADAPPAAPDLYRLGSSRDFGVAWKGRAADGRLTWHAMLGNGAGEGGETNEGKKAMLSVSLQPTKALVVELYGDTEDRPDSSDRTTFHAFVGLRGARSRYGVEDATQERQAAEGPDRTVSVASVFGAWDLGEKLSLLARVDRSFDGIPDAGDIPYLGLAEDTELDLLLVGLDYRIHRAVSVVPNVEVVTYRETDGVPAPDDDLIARLTLSVTF